MWRRWRYWLDEFAYFSPSQRRATHVLIILIVTVQIFSYLGTKQLKLLKRNSTIEDNATLAIIDSILQNIDTNQNFTTKKMMVIKPFNPNLLTKQEWIDLGVQPYVAQRIINYKNNKGTFRRAEDLLKIYGFDTSLFLHLKPYLIINTEIKEPNKAAKTDRTYTKKVELNSADSLQLVELPMIGPILANRIIKYRNILGGFYSSEQIKEVYGLKDENYKAIEHYIVIDTSKIKKLPFYSASFVQLMKHPYIGKELAKQFEKFRKKEKITNIYTLVSSNIITTQQAEKLKHYLSFE